MKTSSEETVTISFEGRITVDRETVLNLLQGAMPLSKKSETPTAITPLPTQSNVSRLSYSVAEAAELLGVCSKTIHRLLQRGLLRSSVACRHKIIPRTEIERFLKETSQ